MDWKYALLAAVVGCSRQAPPSQDATRASQAAIRSEVEQMADDFLARRPMQGFLHDMPLTAAYYWQDVFVDRAARELGLHCLGMTGQGGALIEASDLVLTVPTATTARVQETHIIMGHMLCQLVDQTLFPPGAIDSSD
mgnify:CR=1 FL=1